METAGKEAWVNEVMDTIRRVQRADYKGSVYEHIEGIMQRVPQERGMVVRLRLWSAAAAILMLIDVGSIARYVHLHSGGARENIVAQAFAPELSSTIYTY